MQKPLVSIIMSTYNGSKYIHESINSILDQDFLDFEFIIINDASSDGVEEIILTYQKKDSRIVYIKNKKNLKLTRSLNKAILIAKGKYIARIDDDDIWSAGKLRKQIDFMEKNLDYGLCGSSVTIIDKDGVKQRELNMRQSNEDIKKHFLQSNQFAHSSIVIRKSSLDLAGGIYNPKWNGVEDYELWLRIGKISKLKNLGESLIKYRFLANSVMRKNEFRRRYLSFSVAILHRKGYPHFIRSFILRIPWLILSDHTFSKILSVKKSLFK